VFRALECAPPDEILKAAWMMREEEASIRSMSKTLLKM
jgi:hypothetical protein